MIRCPITLLFPLLLALDCSGRLLASASHPPGWLDTAGQPIQAHGGCILRHGDTYYWYGENKDGPTKPGGCGARVDLIGIQCYTSKDLQRWTNAGIVLAPVRDDASHDLHVSKIMERPKVIYNKRSRKFVMWMHIDSWDYQTARAGVAVSNQATGPFRYLGSMRPNDSDSRDLTVFQDDDGKAYLIYASEGNQTLHIAELSADYLKPTANFARAFADRGMEAPVVFKHQHKYYLIASACTGWQPNAARSAVAASIFGPWTELANPCRGSKAATTFDSQSTFVLPLASERFLFMADRWNSHDLRRSGYLWTALHVDHEQAMLESPADAP